ncbi:MAG: cupredoxin family protein [Aquabacterium sp.]|uniref:cupredoxin domain-containing protein n=1 Tax=Aquabacterium sp. TaxID=1872578 RepID=UPI0027169478|nr:cupredoxin family protein [Aquabacterium sp.]MDO9002571.1 cupredoxin family protein [Aquabacterium sp.]
MTHPILRSALSATALAFLAASSPSALADGAAGHHHEESSAIGVPGEPSQVTRTVKVDMSDNMRFTPANFNVKQGETVRFLVRNVGQLKHEFVLGTQKALLEHYEQMKQNPEMEHADPNMVTLDPGKKGEVIWRFTKNGAVAIGCLQPGHYDAGMKGSVKVAAAVHKSGKTAPKQSDTGYHAPH